MIRFRPLAICALALGLLVAGAPQPAAAQDTGSADFSRFVALGDSLGAAFLSGGLVRGAQENSVPALIARQATGRQIEQPLLSEPGIPALLQLRSLSPVVIAPVPGTSQPLNLGLQRPYDNLSVPGYRLGDALRDRRRTGLNFPTLILRVEATMLEQALALQPTFALVWLGNNDVLAAATSGRVIEGATMTPVAQFRADYIALVSVLKAAGVDLALANLPDVSSIPYVNTISRVLINPTTRQPVLGPGGQPIPLIGPDGPLGPGDRVLLPASAKLSQGIGVPTFAGGTGQPLADNDVLSAAEASAIQARVVAFNAIIRDVARQSRSSLADIDGLLRQAAGPGFNIGGVTFTEDFITGGTFSLDGVHPSPLGYAVLANEFLRSINATYGADIPPVDLFPFMFGDDAAAIPAGGVGEFIFTSEAAQQLLGALRVDPGDSRGGGPRAPKGPKSGRRASDHPSLRPPGH